MKPVVHFKPSSHDFIVKGCGAMVFPTDHPSGMVSNTKAVFTTGVIRVEANDDGVITEFETANTIYKREDTPCPETGVEG